jgi:fluoroacetyl-CoA thioesterase
MKPGLKVGDQATYEKVVSSSDIATFRNKVVHPLYATFKLAEDVEWTCRQLILPYLEPHEEGAGTELYIRHLAPTPIGQRVRIVATVTEVTERRVVARFEAFNEAFQIAEGHMTQAILPKAKFREIVQEIQRKAARMVQ